jgi:hypothetical protein
VPAEQVDQHGFLVGVGEQVLDRLETGIGGCREAVEEVMLVVEKRQVGGELGHAATPGP